MTRFLLSAINGAKSTEGNKLVESLQGQRFKDGAQDVFFREWDHQLIRRPVIGTAQANGSDKWDTLKVSSQSATSAADLDRLFGSKEEVGCNMEAL
jgi:branched-chain amino acid transport system substrate-binding protein